MECSQSSALEKNFSFICILSAYKKENSHINFLCIDFKKLKNSKRNPKQEEIIKTRAKINEIEKQFSQSWENQDWSRVHSHHSYSTLHWKSCPVEKKRKINKRYAD